MVHYFSYGTDSSPERVQKMIGAKIPYARAYIEAKFLYFSVRGAKAVIPYAIVPENVPKVSPKKIYGVLYEMADSQFRKIKEKHKPERWAIAELTIAVDDEKSPHNGKKIKASSFVLKSKEAVAEAIIELTQKGLIPKF